MEGQKIKKPAKRHLGDKKGYYANEENYKTKTWHYETKQNVPTMKQFNTVKTAKGGDKTEIRKNIPN